MVLERQIKRRTNRSKPCFLLAPCCYNEFLMLRFVLFRFTVSFVGCVVYGIYYHGLSQSGGTYPFPLTQQGILVLNLYPLGYESSWPKWLHASTDGQKNKTDAVLGWLVTIN